MTDHIFFSFLAACAFVYNSTISPNGSFTSPNWPGLYPRDTECHYFFFGRPSEKVHITFAYFDIEGVSPWVSSWCLNSSQAGFDDIRAFFHSLARIFVFRIFCVTFLNIRFRLFAILRSNFVLFRLFPFTLQWVDDWCPLALNPRSFLSFRRFPLCSWAKNQTHNTLVIWLYRWERNNVLSVQLLACLSFSFTPDFLLKSSLLSRFLVSPLFRDISWLDVFCVRLFNQSLSVLSPSINSRKLCSNFLPFALFCVD